MKFKKSFTLFTNLMHFNLSSLVKQNVIYFLILILLYCCFVY